MDEAERARLLDGLAGLHLPDGGGVAPAWWIGAALALTALGIAALVFARRRAGRDGGGRSDRLRAESAAEIGVLRALLADASADADRDVAGDAGDDARAGVAPAVAHEVLARSSVLVRRLALAALPRERVAALQGDAWLGTLDELCGEERFARGPGRLLESGPYEARPSATVAALRELLDAVDALGEAVASRGTRHGAGRVPS